MLQQYFDRIGYTDSAEPTYETLYALHTAHVFSIPFENLDVYYGKGISLEPERIFDKLVTRGRGGYCFEMNALFSGVLTQMGFKVHNMIANKLHQIMSVEIDGREYLADVGYGNEGIAAPLSMELFTEQTRFCDTYRFMKAAADQWTLERKTPEGYTAMYTFSPEDRDSMDFEIANHYTATHPKSVFRATPFLTIPTPTGRITLTGKHLKITDNGAVTESEIADGEAFARCVREKFGLDVDEIKREAAEG